jgi:hypothetical protein
MCLGAKELTVYRNVATSLGERRIVCTPQRVMGGMPNHGPRDSWTNARRSTGVQLVSDSASECPWTISDHSSVS